jgi:hypothetical protein
MATRDAVVFQVHFASPELDRHIARLRRETQGIIDVFVAFNIGKAAALRPGASADIVITLDKCAATQPRRFAEYRSHGLESIYHFADLLMMAALTDPVLAPYEHVWFVEYDVDYSGNWGDFFRRAASYQGDLLGTHMRTRSEQPDFDHWFWYEQPDWVKVEAVRGFFPISRFSKPMIQTLLTEMEKPGWKGHFELVYPTLARACGLTIGDLGDRGSFTPPEREQQNYVRGERTHMFRPPRSFQYFGDDQRRYRHRDRIYHPIKTEWTRSRKLKEIVGVYWYRANRAHTIIRLRERLGFPPMRPKIGL